MDRERLILLVAEPPGPRTTLRLLDRHLPFKNPKLEETEEGVSIQISSWKICSVFYSLRQKEKVKSKMDSSLKELSKKQFRFGQKWK